MSVTSRIRNMVDFVETENFTITTGAGNDIITTGGGNDIITTGGGNDIITTGGGMDVLNGGAGNDTLNGGLGTDSAIFAGLRSAYTLTDLGGGGVLVSGPDGIDTLTSVERLVFDDQTVIWPLGSVHPPNDFNGDAKSDILWRSVTGDVVTWENLANGQHGGESFGNVGLAWTIADTGDFSGDGKADFLWRGSNGDVVTWENLVNGQHGGQSYGNVGLGWNILGADDFNGDGQADILWRSINGDVVTWENLANGQHGGQSFGNVGLGWRIVGSGDFSGDGKADILWRAVNGDVVIWEPGQWHARRSVARQRRAGLAYRRHRRFQRRRQGRHTVALRQRRCRDLGEHRQWSV
jgi:hypothetical protein